MFVIKTTCNYFALTKRIRHWIQPWMKDAEGQRTQKQIWAELIAWMEEAQPGCIQRLS